MSLRNKRILITAGPTWVPIDSVRVISNCATGRTGIMLAEKCAGLGSRVTLLLGPIGNCAIGSRIKLIRYTFFEEFRLKIKKELNSRRYDIIIHSAAVADFKPAQIRKGKIDSGHRLLIRFTPLPKIINDIRRACPCALLVMFKLEAGVSDAALVRRARAAQKKAGADYCVANRLNPYRACIIDREAHTLPVKNKSDLVNKLCNILSLHER